MIAARYLSREILLATAGVAAVLLCVTVGARLAGYLGDAAAGRLSAQAVVLLVGLRLPGYLALLLPLSFLAGLLLALARLQEDSELTVLGAAGLGERWLAGRALTGALLVAALVAGLSLWLVPMTSARIETVFADARGLQALANLVPGRFQPLGADGLVARAQRIDRATGALGDVLLVDERDGARRILRARAGSLGVSADGAARVLSLARGQRYEWLPDGTVRRGRFARLEQRIEVPDAAPVPDALAARSTRSLVADPAPGARAELHWRLVLPVLVPVLALLGVTLWRSVPARPGETGVARVLPPLAAFLILFALVVSGRDAAASGQLTPFVGLWLAPLAALLLGLGLLVRLERGPRG